MMGANAGVWTRALVAIAALFAAGLYWQVLRPLLLHLFAAGRDWLMAEPLGAVVLLSLLYGALLACLLMLFAVLPDTLVAETRASVQATLLVCLPVGLAPVLLMIPAASRMPIENGALTALGPAALVTLAQSAHWWRLRTLAAPA